MLNWVLLAVLAAAFYGAYNFFIKIASGHINQIVGAVILQVVAAITGIVILGWMITTGQSIEISNKGLILAGLAGLAVGLAEITTFFFYSKGVSVSIGTPIIIGGSVFIAAILGVLLLKETITPIQGFAGILIIIGIGLLFAKF